MATTNPNSHLPHDAVESVLGEETHRGRSNVVLQREIAVG